MFRGALFSVVLVGVTSCAEVPSSLCFFDEVCTADGGRASRDGGVERREVANIASSIGLSTTWGEVESLLTPTVSPPVVTSTQVSFPVPLRAGCSEPYRGGVVLPDLSRVLAIPFCTDQFAVAEAQTQSVDVVGDPITDVRPVGNQEGWYAGGVLGCDGRVYVFPWAASSMMRVTSEGNDLVFEPLAFSSGSGPRHMMGGVAVPDCSSGLTLYAGGRGGIRKLHVYETEVEVTQVTTEGNFTGLALVGDDTVMGLGTDDANTRSWFVRIDLRTGQPTVTSYGVGLETRGAVTTGPTSPPVAFGVGPLTGRFLELDGGVVPVGAPGSVSALGWPVNPGHGWLLAAGSSLVAWKEDRSMNVELGAMPPSGGLIFIEDVVVSLPGDAQGDFVFFQGSEPNVSAFLSPWFNKL